MIRIHLRIGNCTDARPGNGAGFFMPNAVFFVDGFNLYHALDFTKIGPNPVRYRKYKWLNLARLAQFYLPDANHQIAEVVLFTTVVTWDVGKEARHRLLIKALQDVGVRVVEGAFKDKDVRCKICLKYFKAREEKRTDVNIAVEMLKMAHRGAYDRAIVLTGDTDLIPAFDAVRQLHNHIKISAVIPNGKTSRDIRKAADASFQMTEVQLSQSLLPDPMTLKNGTILNKPVTWV